MSDVTLKDAVCAIRVSVPDGEGEEYRECFLSNLKLCAMLDRIVLQAYRRDNLGLGPAPVDLGDVVIKDALTEREAQAADDVAAALFAALGI